MLHALFRLHPHGKRPGKASARRGRGKQLRPGEQQGICLRAPLRIARAVHAAGVDRVVPRQNVIQTQEILERVILRNADDQLLARCDGQKTGALSQLIGMLLPWSTNSSG